MLTVYMYVCIPVCVHDDVKCCTIISCMYVQCKYLVLINLAKAIILCSTYMHHFPINIITLYNIFEFNKLHDILSQHGLFISDLVNNTKKNHI